MAEEVEVEVTTGDRLPPVEHLPHGMCVLGNFASVATGEGVLGLLKDAGLKRGNAFLRVGRSWRQVTPGPLPLGSLMAGKPTLDHLYIFLVVKPPARGQSFPLLQASYTEVLQGYESSQSIEHTVGETWKHRLVKIHPELGKIATEFQAKLSKLVDTCKRDQARAPQRWVIKVCQSEPDDSYESGGEFLEYLTLLVYRTSFSDVFGESLARRGAFFRHNKRLKTSGNSSVTPPDLAFCGLKFPFVDLGDADVYSYLRICWEFKVQTADFRDGMGQLLDRSQRCRLGSNTPEKERVIFGAATTGLAFLPMIILAETYGGQAVCGPIEELGSLDTDTRTGRPVCRVDIETPTFREILFQVYASLYYQLRISMKAAAEPQTSAYRPTPEHRLNQPRPEKRIIQCGDQEHEFQVLRDFVDGPFKGGTYLVRCGSLSEGLLVLKRGPFQAAQDLIVAMHGGKPVKTWSQVETELKVRRILGTSDNLKISELVASGEIKSPWNWVGCPALVTKFHGQSLEDTTLPIHEVTSMGIALIQTVVELHRRGVYHTDISPKNITYDGEKLGSDKFRLIDLGVAIYTLEEEPRSYILDLEFGSINSVRQEELTTTADFESILYSMVRIAGMELPWSEAARTDDRESVNRIRSELMIQGSVIGIPPPNGLFGILESFVLNKTSLQELIYFAEKLEAPSSSQSAVAIRNPRVVGTGRLATKKKAARVRISRNKRTLHHGTWREREKLCRAAVASR